MENLPKNAPLAAVIFDLDGTVLDTLDDLTDSVNAALARFALPLHTKEEMRHFVGNGIERMIARAIPGGETHPDYSSCLAAFREHYAIHMQDKTAPYPGVFALLSSLHEQGIRVAIFSNKFDAAVKTLVAHDFPGAVDLARGECAEIPKKPDPRGVHAILRELDCPIGQALYVGDSEVDVATAKAAGIRGVFVTWGFRDEAELRTAGAEDIVHSVDELRAFLQEKSGSEAGSDRNEELL